ncbi:hypothetical protein [Sphingobium sp. CFD-2]|uniref:hypothetical protein n=1 Tax=Sphingobium sp. CFD-2 TaxID=2878542 RepID=UPI00214BF239|nr:hypothetical protein [Sphingobium sp. CFD-2]
MTLSIKLQAAIKGTIAKTVDDRTISAPVSEAYSHDLSTGTAADQATHTYVKDFSLASGANTTFDLAGSLTDDLGQACVFTAIKAILLISDSDNTTNLTLGNGSNPFVGPFDDGTATVTVKPGGAFMISDPSATGMAVAAGTGDILKLANGSGATATGTLVIVGEA